MASYSYATPIISRITMKSSGTFKVIINQTQFNPNGDILYCSEKLITPSLLSVFIGKRVLQINTKSFFGRQRVSRIDVTD